MEINPGAHTRGSVASCGDGNNSGGSYKVGLDEVTQHMPHFLPRCLPHSSCHSPEPEVGLVPGTNCPTLSKTSWRPTFLQCHKHVVYQTPVSKRTKNLLALLSMGQQGPVPTCWSRMPCSTLGLELSPSLPLLPPKSGP